ncbi:hypothetical protein BGZ46_005054 [Entomortierella lignicola]|nr:hypothetical protein BGZ46_005054 [Entomortierella lignicola]
MLAHNKIQVDTSHEYIHAAQPQCQSPKYNRRETFWALPNDVKATQYGKSQEDHPHRYSNNHQTQLEQPEKQTYQEEKLNLHGGNQNHRRHYQHRSLSSSPFPVPQKNVVGEIMDLDQGYEFEELESDSMMDQCEPQRGWSSSSSLQTNSPSPVMSYTPHQLPSLKRHYSFSSYTSHHSQQEPPPPQQQPLRDQYSRPRLSYLDHSHGPSQPYHHRLYDEQQQGQQCYTSTDETLDDSQTFAKSDFRQWSPRVYPSRKSKTRPCSFPSDDIGSTRYESRSGSVSPMMFSQTLSMDRQSGLSSSIRSLTPPYLNPSLLRQSEDLCGQNERVGEGRKRERDIEREGGHHKRIVLPLPKCYEYMSEAQRTLYERHPPSPPQHDKSSTSSSNPPSPYRNSQSPSTPVSPIQPVRHASFERSYSDIPHHLPPLPVHFGPLERQNTFPLDRRQHETWKSHHAQQISQGMVHQLPLQLSSLDIPRRQSYSEVDNLRSSSEFPSTSSMPLKTTALLPSPPMPLPSKALLKSLPTTTNTVVPASTANSFPETEGMTVIKSEEGAIMVYNHTTETMIFRCELCPGETFGRIHDLKRHQNSKHQDMTWPCDYCHRPFVRRDALLRHYTVKAARDDGVHPASHEVEELLAALGTITSK